jgi:phosphomannomutase
MNTSIFKAYDIRGLYPSEVNEEAVYKIGRATAQYLQARTVAIGRDARSHSPALFESLARGLTDVM